MSIFELTAVLDHHKIIHVVKNGHVLAMTKDRINSQWIDVTDWSRMQMVAWLGH